MRSPKEMQMMIEKLKAEVAMLKQQLLENGITPLIAVPKKGGAALVDEEETKDEEPLLASTANTPQQQKSATASSSQIADDEEKSQGVTQSQSLEESKDAAATASNGNKDDVSFNTLLNDSELSFNPTSAVGEAHS